MECGATKNRFAVMFNSPGSFKEFFAGSPVIENGTSAAIGAVLEQKIADY